MTEAWASFEAWMMRHDLTLDLITVWSISAGLHVWALVKAYSWWVIWHTRDRTAIGRTMRPQKAAEAVMGLSLALLYDLTLFAYYTGWIPTFWQRLALRLLLIVAVIGASAWGLRFAAALRATRHREGG